MTQEQKAEQAWDVIFKKAGGRFNYELSKRIANLVKSSLKREIEKRINIKETIHKDLVTEEGKFINDCIIAENKRFLELLNTVEP